MTRRCAGRDRLVAVGAGGLDERRNPGRAHERQRRSLPCRGFSMKTQRSPAKLSTALFLRLAFELGIAYRRG
jgi:hypothetical protein